MHEYSVARSLLEAVESNATQHDAIAVHRVHLRIGELAGIEAELLQTAFTLAREKTVCAEAELEIVSAPAEWQCPVCTTSIPKGTALACSDCGVPARMISGDEILLERLEMEIA